MTATEKKINIPELRFPEFDGEWVEKKLGEIASFSKGKGISKDDIKPDGELECIRYGELYTHYSEVIDKIKSKTNVNVKNLILSELNDVIIPASGETQIDIATASCVLKKGVALGGDLNIIKSSLDGIFLSYYLNNKKKKEIASLAQGNSIVHLYSNQLKTLHVNVPVEPEQQKIATFLTALDKRIHLLTRKKEKLEHYKKGVMQKLFSRELRFRDENGNDYPEWEEKGLGEIFIRVKRKNTENNKNVLTISAQFGLVSQLDFFKNSVASKNLKGYYLLEHNEFAYNKSYSKGYPLGATKRLSLYEKGVVSTLYICFKCNKSIIPLFAEQFFESGIHNRELYKIAQEGSRNHGLLNVSVEDFFNTKIIVPFLPEQQKIASFLTAIDKQIEQVARQIEHSNQWKKGLLQKMFV